VSGARRSRGPALAAWIVDHGAPITAAWVIAAVVALPNAIRLDSRLVAAGRDSGSESALVESTLSSRFASPFARHAVLVISGVSATSESGQRVLSEATTAIDSLPFVTAVLAPGPRTAWLVAGENGAMLVAGLPAAATSADSFIVALRIATDRVASRLRPVIPQLTMRWTGETALNLDLRAASAQDVRAGEARALPLTLVLLVAAFGAIVAAFVPLICGVLAVLIAFGALSALSVHWPLSIIVQSVASILGLALGIDYALLMLSRFREARADQTHSHAAAANALLHAGPTILVSAFAVAIGFAALLLVPLAELRSAGVGGLVIVSVTALLATTLLPSVLAWLGPRIDLGRLYRPGRAARSTERWRRWGLWVTRHAPLVALMAAAPLVALSVQALRLRARVPSTDWLPASMESAAGLRDIGRLGRGSLVYALRVVLELPPGVSAVSPAGWRATERLTLEFARDGDFARVRSLPALVAGGLPFPLVLAVVPDSIERIFVSRDSGMALVDLTPREELRPWQLTETVRRLRAMDVGRVTGLPGTRLMIGGLPAFNADYEDVVATRLGGVVLVVVIGTFVALVVGFRSLLVPVKAIVLNLLSVLAALGAVVLVFQDGYGAQLLGLDASVDGVFPSTPILVFCIVFGISMDYEVFLVARVAEARRTGLDNAAAIAEGLARTGRLITSAAAIMVAVFGAFAIGEFLPTTILGFALATAVLVDAIIIRVALGPALLKLAGRWNWWPS
jgi:RND superfamily putative drug exporter